MSRPGSRRRAAHRKKKRTLRKKHPKQRGGYLPLPLPIPFSFPPLPSVGGFPSLPPPAPIKIEFKEIESFIPRKDTSAPKDIKGIPLVIYRTWVDKKIPMGMWNAIHKCLETTPEFDNYFYDDVDCLKFIEDNFDTPVVKAYKCLKPGAYKADLWRYCILYKKGGVYSDCKMIIEYPLLSVMKEKPIIYIQDMPDRKWCSTPYPGIWNGFMSSAPGSAILKACIDEIVESCKNRNYRDNGLDLTGPCLLARKIAEIEGSDMITKSPYTHRILKQFHYKDKLLLSEYPTYRVEVDLLAKKPHYMDSYNRRDVFDKTITFDTNNNPTEK